MYARVNTLEASADRIEDGIRYMQEQVVPWGREIEGFKGTIALVDRDTGKSIGITFWDDQDKMLASETSAAEVRSGAGEAFGGATPTVERYEVVLWEV